MCMTMCSTIKPFIKCVDFWPERLTKQQLAVYKKMMETGQIRTQHVVYNRSTGSTTVEYYSTVPHEWIRKEMKELAGTIEVDPE